MSDHWAGPFEDDSVMHEEPSRLTLLRQSIPTRRRQPINMCAVAIGAIALALVVVALPIHAQSVVMSEPTRVTLSASAAAVNAGEGVTLVAAVTGAHGQAVPGGTITFVDETTLCVLGWRDVSAPAFAVDGLPAGAHLIHASYSGTADFLPSVIQPSQSGLTVITVREPVEVNVSSSDNPSAPGQAITLTATVRGTAAEPTGAVTFSDGATILASHIALDRKGRASFTTSALADGARAIVAIYEGDGEHGRAVSQRLLQDVGARTGRDRMRTP